MNHSQVATDDFEFAIGDFEFASVISNSSSAFSNSPSTDFEFVIGDVEFAISDVEFAICKLPSMMSKSTLVILNFCRSQAEMPGAEIFCAKHLHHPGAAAYIRWRGPIIGATDGGVPHDFILILTWLD